MTTIHCRIDSIKSENGKFNAGKCELWADESEDAVENIIALAIAEAIKERIEVMTKMSENLFISPIEPKKEGAEDEEANH